jgi:hypothetical protein
VVAVDEEEPLVGREGLHRPDLINDLRIAVLTKLAFYADDVPAVASRR